MSWGERQWSFAIVYGLDRFAAAVFFLRTDMSISAMAGLVKAERYQGLRLRAWQVRFLRWLEPKLSYEHCKGAIAHDLARAQAAVALLTLPEGKP